MYMSSSCKSNPPRPEQSSHQRPRNRESSFPSSHFVAGASGERAASDISGRTLFYPKPIYLSTRPPHHASTPPLRFVIAAATSLLLLQLASLYSSSAPDPRASMAHSLAASFSPAAARRQVRTSWTSSWLDLVARSLVYKAVSLFLES